MPNLEQQCTPGVRGTRRSRGRARSGSTAVSAANSRGSHLAGGGLGDGGVGSLQQRSGVPKSKQPCRERGEGSRRGWWPGGSAGVCACFVGRTSAGIFGRNLDNAVAAPSARVGKGVMCPLHWPTTKATKQRNQICAGLPTHRGVPGWPPAHDAPPCTLQEEWSGQREVAVSRWNRC